MGLQGQISDVSSDSIPLMLFALIAASLNYLRSFFLRLRCNRPLPAVDGASSGLANLVLLCDQLHLNRVFSYRHRSSIPAADDICVVCLYRLKDGDHVRKLDCRHVFHKSCLEGWLHHLNFTCPLCRSSLVADTRLGADLIALSSPHS
ncbi:PREDICTED: E3 ubiquitin-protein ligase RHA2A [Tarenaya hassleriana]|uniref:E3 ubiquitin-protein ligase RHA2A n=1 Tax=Tarenaya hassleriana TaxID=28532 RepID=UPI00053C74E4|nr:PREDICTED: E3 ubiquitin-protein ligase RHA2A [Tarenaya hassleriana]